MNSANLPTTEIKGAKFSRIILGCLPFLGQTYQSREKNKHCIQKFTKIESILPILEKARSEGVDAISVVPGNESFLARNLLEAIRLASERANINFKVAPCLRIPLQIGDEAVNDYRRWATYIKLEESNLQMKPFERYANDPILRFRVGWMNRLREAYGRGLWYGEREVESINLDYDKMETALESLEGFKVLFVEPGSETDFLALTDRIDLLSELIKWLRSRGYKRIILGTHHAGTVIPILERKRLDFEGYLTPINEFGIMMHPTPKSVLEAIRSTSRAIIAVKTMAGGRIPPERAFEYVFNFRNISAYILGVSSLEELKEDLSVIRRVLATT